MVIPVVVQPDMDSKKESMGFRVPLRVYGREPTNAMINHAIETVIIVCFVLGGVSTLIFLNPRYSRYRTNEGIRNVEASLRNMKRS